MPPIDLSRRGVLFPLEKRAPVFSLSLQYNLNKNLTETKTSFQSDPDCQGPMIDSKRTGKL